MSFAIRNLSVLVYANGYTGWYYKPGADAFDAVCAPDYFADASDMLAPGDTVTVTSAEGARILLVTSVQIGRVRTEIIARTAA